MHANPIFKLLCIYLHITNFYHVSSDATAGLLKILAALNLLFVGIASPDGV